MGRIRPHLSFGNMPKRSEVFRLKYAEKYVSKITICNNIKMHVALPNVHSTRIA